MKAFVGVNLSLPSKPYRNILGKGENAGDHQFLLFTQYFLSYKRQISTAFKEESNCRFQALRMGLL